MSLSRFDLPFPIPENQGRKQTRDSPAPVSNDEEKRAKMALEYYNKENGTDYELGCALLSNVFKSDGTWDWVHCNFAANRDINGISSRKLFFAEMHGDDVATCTWTVTACIVLKGTATVGCCLCSGITHPTHGFQQGLHKPKCSVLPTTSSQPTDFVPKYSFLPTTPSQPTEYVLTTYTEKLKKYKDCVSPCYLRPPLTNCSNHYMPPVWVPVFGSQPSIDWWPDSCEHPYEAVMAHRDYGLAIPPEEGFYRACAEVALKFYNKEKGANYELVRVVVCNLKSNGTWFHCNFTAKPSDGDIPSKLFFCEICLTTNTATACVILEEGSKTADVCCYLCSDPELIHPTHGFLIGLDKEEAEAFWQPTVIRHWLSHCSFE